jgi:hypothetical protein
MPSNMILDRRLRFRGDAERDDNVRGPMKEEKRHNVYRFDGIALDTTNDWAVSLPGTSDTIAISETTGGSVLMTTGTGDNDSCFMSSAIIYLGDKSGDMEARITITDVSGTALFVGFSDAKSEANGQIALQYPAGTFTSTATNVAGFVVDADHATSSIMCASARGDTDTTPVDTGVDWADGETKTLRVKMLADDNAQFILDGDVVAQIPTSITSATLMCLTVQAMTRAGDGSNTVRVHSIDTWQDN